MRERRGTGLARPPALSPWGKAPRATQGGSMIFSGHFQQMLHLRRVVA